MAFTKEEKKRAVDLYFEQGLSLTKVTSLLGYPCCSCLNKWIEQDPRYRKPVRKHYSKKIKLASVTRFLEGETPKDIALSVGCSPAAVHAWVHTFERLGAMGFSEDDTSVPDRAPEAPAKFYQKISSLEKENEELRLENAIMRESIKVLKVESLSLSLSDMNNKEKTRVADALRKDYKLKDILDRLGLARSTYYDEHLRLLAKDKYATLKLRLYRLFFDTGQILGYRRLTQRLRQDSTCPIYASEKVVRRLMRELGLYVIYDKKRRRSYSSYKGEISRAPANLVKKNFHATAPCKLWLTDITEFKLGGGKAYLSATIDCFDGAVVAWAVGAHPTQALADKMLKRAIATLRPGDYPIIHSDRGFHYRNPSWIGLCDKAHLTRSMSKKGSSADNSACEGFFGRLKNEFFYYRDWTHVSFRQFKLRLNSYIDNYNRHRIKKSLGWLSPLQYRQSLGYTL